MRFTTYCWLWLLAFGLWPLVGPYHSDLTQLQLGLDYLIHFVAACVLGLRAFRWLDDNWEKYS